ncbi:MAG: hypothetical protein L0H29_07350 [Sinobacteraceae bacterium]|nr:hypothetical protein [Nevskiaceae bacterium]
MALSARDRWLLALADAGVDVEAAARADMGAISQTLDYRWALYLGDQRTILDDTALDELKRWRLALGLPEEVPHGDPHPLVQMSLRDPSRLPRGEATKALRRHKAELKAAKS